MSYYQVEGRPLAALAHPARKARYGGRLRQGQRRAQLRAARRSAPLAVRCPRRRLNRAATGIRGTAAGQAVALRGVLALRCGAACPFCGWPGLRAVPAAAALPPLPSGVSPPAAASRGARLFGSSLVSGAVGGPCPPAPSAPACAGCAPPRRRARRGPAGPLLFGGAPPCAVPLFPPPFRAAGRLRGAPVGRAGACAACGRFSPAAPPPALARVALRAVFVGPLAGWGSPPYPPRPLPPLVAKGGAVPAASLRRDGRSGATALTYSRPSPRCRCQPPPARRGRRARLTVRKLSTARFAAQRAPHFLPL